MTAANTRTQSTANGTSKGSKAADMPKASAAKEDKDANNTNGQATNPAEAATAVADGKPAEDKPEDKANGVKADGEAAADGKEAAAEEKEEDPEVKKAREEAQKKEDELLAHGQAIAKVRNLLARAYTKPAEEPAQPMTRWDYLMAEMKWLSVDFTQERLWRQTTALYISYEIAKMQGKFGLKTPPKEFRKYHDEITQLRLEAAGSGAGAATSRRSAAALAKQEAAAAAAAITELKLDPEDDPVFADLDPKLIPGTPSVEDVSLTYACDEEYMEKVQQHLMQSDMDRVIRDEITVRSYQFEYEASLVSHLLAVQEQQRAANNITEFGDYAYGEEDDGFGTGKKKKRRGQRGGGGYIIDDYAALGDDDGLLGIGTKRTASKANLDNVYLTKSRVRRTSYRDADIDYDLAAETGGRYGTRRATGALRAGSGRGNDRGRRGATGRDQYQYQAQAAQRQRLSGAGPGVALWNRSESDLLLAVVHEFGLNWTVVSEVLSQSLSLQGIYRTAGACRQRFRQLTQQEGQDYTEDRAFAQLGNLITKQRARELLAGSLPVRDDTLRPLLDTLVQIGAAAKDRKIMEERRNEALRTRRQDAHQSYQTVLVNIMQSTGGRHLNAIELSALVNSAYQQQAMQQKMLAQQAQLQTQQPPAAAGAGQLPPNMGGQPPVAGQPVAGMTQQGTPAGPPMAGLQAPGSAGAVAAVAGHPASGVVAGAAVQPPVAGMPATAATGKQPTAVSVHTINQILQAGRMPNGTEVTPDMRQALETRRAVMMQQMAGGQGQVAGRPPLPPNMAGMAMPPGAAGVYGQQAMPGGMNIAMQQQQQQQMMAQQQAQMAAAAAAQQAAAAGNPPPQQ